MLVTVTVLAAWMPGLTGCKGDEDAGSAAGAVEAAGGLSDEEADLLQRRDALLNSRRSLREKRAALAQERLRVVASGGDTSELDKKADQLAREEAKLGSAEAQLNSDLEGLFAQQRAFLSKLGGTGDKTSQLSAREAGLAGREKSLANRERQVAEREATLAERERKLALRERETCAVAPATIIQTAPAKGTRYSKRDVEPALKKARRTMSRRGILRSDLPAAVQNLESEATSAMASGDYAQARFAATQLASTVASIKINKSFIQAKIARLNSRMQGQKLDDKKRQTVDDLFRKATSQYGDGKFDRANKQLNRIYTQLGKP